LGEDKYAIQFLYIFLSFGGHGMDLQKILYVGIGGFAGAALRYIVSLASARLFGTQLPYGTLIVNVLGGLLIGLLMELSIATDLVPPNLRLFLVTGVLGGLTTFSTFSYETMSLMGDGSWLLAALNTALNLFLSFGGVALGRFIINTAI
jgi:fluoride exporter